MMIFYFGGGFFLFFLFSLESVSVYGQFDFRRVVQQSWLHEVSKSKVALAVFCISLTAFTGQSPRRTSRIVPVHAMFFSVTRVDILERSTRKFSDLSVA